MKQHGNLRIDQGYGRRWYPGQEDDDAAMLVDKGYLPKDFGSEAHKSPYANEIPALEAKLNAQASSPTGRSVRRRGLRREISDELQSDPGEVAKPSRIPEDQLVSFEGLDRLFIDWFGFFVCQLHGWEAMVEI